MSVTAPTSTNSSAIFSPCSLGQASRSKLTKSTSTFELLSRIAHDTSIEDILAELKRFGSYYVAFILGQEEDPKLKDALGRLRQLGEVVSPTVLRLYDCYAGNSR